MLIAPKDRNNDKFFIFVEMLNNYGEDEDCDDQSYYHKGEKFFRTKYEGVMQRIEKNIKYCKEELEKHEKRVKYYKEQIQKDEETLETMKEGNNAKDI
jgi:chaperonin cofactor prefoldin